MSVPRSNSLSESSSFSAEAGAARCYTPLHEDAIDVVVLDKQEARSDADVADKAAVVANRESFFTLQRVAAVTLCLTIFVLCTVLLPHHTEFLRQAALVGSSIAAVLGVVAVVMKTNKGQILAGVVFVPMLLVTAQAAGMGVVYESHSVSSEGAFIALSVLQLCALVALFACRIGASVQVSTAKVTPVVPEATITIASDCPV